MKILIAGAGSVGRTIAKELTKNYSVTLIDKDPHQMRVASVPLADWVLADACEVSTLRDLHVDEVDVVVAATGDDKANLVLSLLAKTEFGVPRVIARINNPANAWLFDESWGVDVPVSTPRIMTTLIEEAVSSGRLVRRLDFYRSGSSLYQGTIAKRAAVVGNAIEDVALPPDMFISTVLRDGVPLPADRDLTLEAGDDILVIVGSQAEIDIDVVNKLISTPKAEPKPEDPAPEENTAPEK